MPLTDLQQRVKHFADQGYPGREVAALIPCNPSLVYDVIGAIRKKGVRVRFNEASQTKIPLRNLPEDLHG